MPSLAFTAKYGDSAITREESRALTRMYKGKTFVFYSPFNSHPGWENGNRGVLVRLRHFTDKSSQVDSEVSNLWIGRNLETGEKADMFGFEAWTSAGNPVVKEQACSNWSPPLVTK